jgi:7,8-dihydropterin-6-yl-methyl-4-(beta-D-ribofuranosyl)aminobenzene 5'-phosphate synthase
MAEVTVVFDNKANENLHHGWGFSCLVKQNNTTVLFDTGWDGHLLLENLGFLGFAPESIDILVLSHQHWDHIGGLSHILHAAKTLKVYVPSSFSRHLKDEISKQAEIEEVTNACEILPGMWSSGELGEKIPEQSLIIQGKRGCYVITGCNHPGIRSVLQIASSFGKVVGILGGLHYLEDIKLLDGLDYIAAGHCTNRQDELKSRYGARYVPIYSGYSVEF